VTVLKPMMGTEPHAFYIEIDDHAIEAKAIKEE
jgi:hypothetical protein